jgi:hypothetical protein
MKIQDIPQTGKLGLTATWLGRNGLIRRILVTPKNPRTDRQLEVRDLLVQQARRFDALNDSQQDAWNVAAAGYQYRFGFREPRWTMPWRVHLPKWSPLTTAAAETSLER